VSESEKTIRMAVKTQSKSYYWKNDFKKHNAF